MNAATQPVKDPFFSRDVNFYKQYFRLFLMLALQNVITYSVNVADNVMLGSYHQAALSGAAAVNQIQYVLQQVVNMGLGEGLMVLGAQYWGRRDADTVHRIAGSALLLGWALGAALTLAAFIAPQTMVGFFTNDPAILEQGVQYLRIMRWSYLIFITTSILLATLRTMQIAGIAFALSLMTLTVNVGINYTLIYGRLGMPEMGIRGAAVGTLTARVLELAVLLVYCRFFAAHRISLVATVKSALRRTGNLMRDYLRVSLPCAVSSLLFAAAVAMQTAILGHISADAIAANSAVGTLFQYGKMIPVSASAAAAVWIGKVIGSGRTEGLRAYVHTLQALFALIGLAVGGLLLLIGGPILSLYTLSPEAAGMARQMLWIMAVIAVGMSYQMPTNCGIVRGGGDAGFVLKIDVVFSWCIVVPLSLAAAFWWCWPVAAVVICMNIDQLLKCPVVFHKANGYTWMKKLTR